MTDQTSQSEDYINQTYVAPLLKIRGGRGMEAVEFYKKAFGAEGLENSFLIAPDGKRIVNAHLHLCGGDFLLEDDFPENNGGVETGPPACVSMHLQVRDADEAWDRAIAAGAEAISPPTTMPWGYRLAHLRDPFEHRWSIGSRKIS